jgi:hypothetical protein
VFSAVCTMNTGSKKLQREVGSTFCGAHRKRVLLIAASVLAARKLAQFDGGKTVSAIADAVRWAEEIMKAIDERWPAGR